ncbi:PPA1309 family protein [Nocardioides convexus]|uniref:PPA1309 family protein n=1 Tax=Nocardioides convexus TaxID=2712224 RepID=UPI00241898DD|nr:PPA1309 family protein [Nocardioides convexus]
MGPAGAPLRARRHRTGWSSRSRPWPRKLGLDQPIERGSLTPIEQEEPAPGTTSLEEVLPGIVWPGVVTGCAAVVERLVLPPAADGQVPEDPEAALQFAREHPDAEEVRIVAGVTRHGAAYCALRMRSQDDDMAVMGGPDLVPGLLESVAGHAGRRGGRR